MIENHIKTKINASHEMNHGNENNGFSVVCLMENGHGILRALSPNSLVQMRVKRPRIPL
jgi:hypothetical protein